MLLLLLYHFANHVEPTSDEIEWGSASTTRLKETPGVYYRFLRLIASTCQNVFLWFYVSIWFLNPLNHGFFSQSSIFVRHINTLGACLRNLAFLVCLLNLAFAWFFIHPLPRNPCLVQTYDERDVAERVSWRRERTLLQCKCCKSSMISLFVSPDSTQSSSVDEWLAVLKMNFHYELHL